MKEEDKIAIEQLISDNRIHPALDALSSIAEEGSDKIFEQKILELKKRFKRLQDAYNKNSITQENYTASYDTLISRLVLTVSALYNKFKFSLPENKTVEVVKKVSRSYIILIKKKLIGLVISHYWFVVVPEHHFSNIISNSTKRDFYPGDYGVIVEEGDGPIIPPSVLNEMIDEQGYSPIYQRDFKPIGNNHFRASYRISI